MFNDKIPDLIINNIIPPYDSSTHKLVICENYKYSFIYGCIYLYINFKSFL